MADIKISYTFRGDKELIQNLRQLSADVRGPLLQNSLYAGALIVQNAAREKAPFKSGTLRRSIHIEPSGTNAVKVGTDLKYAAIHEFGGTIVPKNGKYLKFEINGEVIFAKKVVMPARPYMRPALDENKAKVRQEIRDALLAGIRRVMA